METPGAFFTQPGDVLSRSDPSPSYNVLGEMTEHLKPHSYLCHLYCPVLEMLLTDVKQFTHVITTFNISVPKPKGCFRSTTVHTVKLRDLGCFSVLEAHF